MKSCKFGECGSFEHLVFLFGCIIYQGKYVTFFVKKKKGEGEERKQNMHARTHARTHTRTIQDRQANKL